jgi:hypothetical protein
LWKAIGTVRLSPKSVLVNDCHKQILRVDKIFFRFGSSRRWRFGKRPVAGKPAPADDTGITRSPAARLAGFELAARFARRFDIQIESMSIAAAEVAAVVHEEPADRDDRDQYS